MDAITRYACISLVMYEWTGVENWWIVIDRGETGVLEDKSNPVPPCPSQISLGLAWERGGPKPAWDTARLLKFTESNRKTKKKGKKKVLDWNDWSDFIENNTKLL